VVDGPDGSGGALWDYHSLALQGAALLIRPLGIPADPALRAACWVWFTLQQTARQTAAEVIPRPGTTGRPPIGYINVNPFTASAQAIDLARPPDRPPAPAAAPVTVYRQGERSYALADRPPVCVSVEEDNILRAFLGTDRALDTRALRNAGCENVSRVIGRLETHFPGAVRRPGARGEGYYLRVRNAADRPAEARPRPSDLGSV
jgi:hypothetical protein